MAMSITSCSFSNKKADLPNVSVSNEVSDFKVKPEAFDSNIKNNSLAISPDEKLAIVSNSTIDQVKIYDLLTKKEIKVIDEVVTPRHVAFSKNGDKFYISDSTYGTIREFDSLTLNELRSFEVGQGVFGFVLNGDGKKIFANNQHKSTVTVINLETGNIDKIIEGFDQPRQGIVIDENDKYVYVTNFKSNDVRVINTDTFNIEKTLKGIPSVRAISVDTEKNVLYGASSSDNTINVLDISTGEIIKTISVGNEPYGAALSKDKKTIISGEKGSNQLSVIDTDTLEVVRTITGLNEPRQAIVYGLKNGQAYVLNADLSISIVDYNEGKVLEKIN